MNKQFCSVLDFHQQRSQLAWCLRSSMSCLAHLKFAVCSNFVMFHHIAQNVGLTCPCLICDVCFKEFQSSFLFLFCPHVLIETNFRAKHLPYTCCKKSCNLRSGPISILRLHLWKSDLHCDESHICPITMEKADLVEEKNILKSEMDHCASPTWKKNNPRYLAKRLWGFSSLPCLILPQMVAKGRSQFSDFCKQHLWRKNMKKQREGPSVLPIC